MPQFPLFVVRCPTTSRGGYEYEAGENCNLHVRPHPHIPDSLHIPEAHPSHLRNLTFVMAQLPNRFTAVATYAPN